MVRNITNLKLKYDFYLQRSEHYQMLTLKYNKENDSDLFIMHRFLQANTSNVQNDYRKVR